MTVSELGEKTRQSEESSMASSRLAKELSGRMPYKCGRFRLTRAQHYVAGWYP